MATPKLILDNTRASSYLSKAGHESSNNAYMVVLTQQSPKMPTIMNSGALTTSSAGVKRQLASLDTEDVKRMRKRIHEMSFLRKEQERQMEVMSVIERNSMIGNKSNHNASVISKVSKKDRAMMNKINEGLDDIYIPANIMPKILNRSSFQGPNTTTILHE
jgi:hypothetical protein